MKRIHHSPFILSLGLTAASAALAQTGADVPADFGPPPPPGATQAQDASAAPQAPEAPVPQRAADMTQFELAPRAVDEEPVVGETRQAAPATPPRELTRSPDAQTGPYLGRGLFNNWGPDDFGA
jgi:hypothetical protein